LISDINKLKRDSSIDILLKSKLKNLLKELIKMNQFKLITLNSRNL